MLKRIIMLINTAKGEVLSGNDWDEYPNVVLM